jgi:ribulose-bisphosphate carboxylase large chain
MMTASPMQLARMRDAAAATTTPIGTGAAVGGPTPYNTPAPGAAGAGAPKLPTISFSEMFGASPSDLMKLRTARDRAAEASTTSVPPADPSRFLDMYGGSPAQLARMRGTPNALSSFSSSLPSAPSASTPGSLRPYAALSSVGADRFVVVYDVESPDEATCRDKVLAICLEQTVELPASLVPEGTWIRDNVVGRLERLTPGAGMRGSWRAEVSYHADTTGGELTQLINVIFGNTSMKEGVMVADVVLPPSMLTQYPGPRFGAKGLRALTNVSHG